LITGVCCFYGSEISVFYVRLDLGLGELSFI